MLFSSFTLLSNVGAQHLRVIDPLLFSFCLQVSLSQGFHTRGWELPSWLAPGAPDLYNNLPTWTPPLEWASQMSHVQVWPHQTCTSSGCPQLRKWYHHTGKWAHARSLGCHPSLLHFSLLLHISLSRPTNFISQTDLSSTHLFPSPLPLSQSRTPPPFIWPVITPSRVVSLYPLLPLRAFKTANLIMPFNLNLSLPH